MILTNIDPSKPTSPTKRYTICNECNNELYSPSHDKDHLLWMMKLNRPKKSKIVEVVIDGVLHRGVVYPVSNVDDVI